MAQQALYPKLIESRIFDSQAEAIAWGKQKRQEYKDADMVAKVDTKPADSTRRRWLTEVFLKV
ncbi:hypothetical protein ACI3PL_22350 [Lacticaseibacillus paracasei]